MGIYKRGDTYWYRFNWYGEQIRESTKQSNKRVAEQIEAARKTGLAKGEVGLHERRKAPTLADFAKTDFLPYIHSTFASKLKTAAYYENGVKNLTSFDALAGAALDAINTELIGTYVSKRRSDGLQVSSINRELQVLRRMFAMALEWDKVYKSLPRVRMLPGELHRERVLTDDEESIYLANATPLLRTVATILLDCALRPEECFGSGGRTFVTVWLRSITAKRKTPDGEYPYPTASHPSLTCRGASPTANGCFLLLRRAGTLNHPPSRNSTRKLARAARRTIRRPARNGSIFNPSHCTRYGTRA